MVQAAHHRLGDDSATLWRIDRSRLRSIVSPPGGKKCRAPANPTVEAFCEDHISTHQLTLGASARVRRVSHSHPERDSNSFHLRQRNRRKAKSHKAIDKQESTQLSRDSSKSVSFGELNDFSSNAATHGLAPQAESRRSRLFAFFRIFWGFCAPKARRRFSRVRRDHPGSERKPQVLVRTPNVSRTNSPTLAPETTRRLTVRPLSPALWIREGT
jgi:hypothetical protein